MSDKLKEKIFNAQSEGDIASLYVLESEAHEKFDEDTLMAYYANILDLALERLTNALENLEQLDMTQVQDFATLRALYEYAIEHYSAGSVHDASALFEVLGGISNDEAFSEAMKVHRAACDAQIPFDDFIESYVDMNATQNGGKFYISYFTKGIGE
ncbi:hypothetical protein E0765_01665 [Sulfuricurvum sp. IAE1]|jgi:hypothetical protein|uniref:hypothetical protein n=1 Tax=Sulfuricurvum sp. IAE1 TaxID=2546102 RepID=UPI001053245B|nr:hypothetical protein [Sulfuricurvum sp. IAE1]MDD3770043.1 hypothetical protein [Sulfuricurvum sp.]MDX9965694.1 hypothetical protein [Sulfuricurvum sp.]TDA69151.1 hypothetical protein E0765_01665 [Sulfuricurvum sp. IAE1]